MNIGNLKSVIVCVLVILNILLVLRVSFDNKHHINEEKQKLLFQKALENTMFFGLKYESNHINIDSLNSQTTPSLCYYASEFHCSPCVDSVFVEIKKFSASHKNFKLTVLARYTNLGDYMLFKRLHKLENGIININSNQSEIFQSEFPLLFVYKSDNKQTEMVFLPEKSKPAFTQRYLSLVYTKYFANY